MNHNNDMIKLVKLVEGQQEFAGEKVGQKPGDQVRGTDKAKVGGKDHPFKGRLVGEDTTLEDVLSKKYQDFKDIQAKEKAKKKEKEELDEVSLGDYRKKAGMQKAQAGMGAMFAPSAEQRAQELARFKKRERGLERVKARDEKARKAEQERQMADTIARLPELKAEYEEMRRQYKALGGSDWQYADREQNLTDAERRARAMEGPMNNLWRQIQAAEKAQKDQGMSEGYLDRPGEVDSPVASAITRRILLQRTDLLAKHGPEKVMAAIDDVADWVGDVDEIGSSDVSAWVRQVEQALGNEVDEAAPALVRAAAGLGMGALSGTGGGILGATLGPILGTAFAAYAGYSGAKLGMQAADDIWDWAAKKFGSEQNAETFVMAHARAAAQGEPQFSFNGKTFKTTLQPNQAKSAVQAVKQVAEARHMTEASNPTDKITVDVPLMLRIMEYAREDAQDDMDLHDVTEKLVELSAGGRTLSMSDYDAIVGMTAEQKLSELGATPPAPPQGTATAGATAAGNATPTSGSISPDEQKALNKINQTPAMKQQLDKLMTQATPGGASKPMVLDPKEQDALERVKSNAGLGSQYAKLIAQANPAAAKTSVAKP